MRVLKIGGVPSSRLPGGWKDRHSAHSICPRLYVWFTPVSLKEVHIRVLYNKVLKFAMGVSFWHIELGTRWWRRRAFRTANLRADSTTETAGCARDGPVFGPCSAS